MIGAQNTNRKHASSGHWACKELDLDCVNTTGCEESEGGPRETLKATIRPSSGHPLFRFGPMAGLPFPCPAQMNAESVSLDRNRKIVSTRSALLPQYPIQPQLPWRWLFPHLLETLVLFALESCRGGHRNVCSEHTWLD